MRLPVTWPGVREGGGYLQAWRQLAPGSRNDNWWVRSGAEDPKSFSNFLRMAPRQTPGQSLPASGILAGQALQCKAELVLLLHFSPLFTARELHELVQKGFPDQLSIIA